MTNMKKLITSLLTICSVSLGAFAAENTSSFESKEFSAGILYGGTVSDLGGRNDLNSGHGVVRATYFLTKYIGGFAQVGLDHDGSRAIDSGGAGLLARYPIGNLAPYAGLSTDYDVLPGDTSHNIRLGAEYRLSNRLSLTGEVSQDIEALRADRWNLLAGVNWRF